MRAPLLALSLGALALAACTPHPSIYADARGVEAHDIRVFAADHMMIDGQDLTLADAEAPQPGVKGACAAEGAAGDAAIAATRALLAGARHLEVHGADDGTGRRLVNVDGLDLGQALIAQGVAVTRRDVAMDWCLRAATEPQRFAAAEARRRYD
jgi:endonuclease YncB( thermonuclease family)